MGRPTKFTEQVRTTILEALKVGAPRYMAAGVAGVSPEILRRWLREGERAAEGMAKRRFVEDVLAAEEHPKVRALGIIYNEMPNNPMLAWKCVERRVEGFGPPRPQAPGAPAGPLRIQLSLTDGRSFALRSGPPIEEVADEGEDQAGLPPVPGPLRPSIPPARQVGMPPPC